MKTTDKISVSLCGFAALLCAFGSVLAPYAFICSSIFGLKESYKQKALSGIWINIIFLLLNTYNAIAAFF